MTRNSFQIVGYYGVVRLSTWGLIIFLATASILSCKGSDGPASDLATVNGIGIDSTNSIKTPIIFEVITPAGTATNADTVYQLIRTENKTVRLYHWKNRLVAYGEIKDTARLRSRILEQDPSSTVAIYGQPFYHFNRKQCANQETARDWNNIILTANLVSDSVLQEEYMEYHARQSKDWPEVGQGFCRADFQQLLLYRNGRQLMLVISIPEGTSLDELNPRTSENNPRVNEWNQLMKKYQEGVSGTYPGEVWVQLQPVKGGRSKHAKELTK